MIQTARNAVESSFSGSGASSASNRIAGSTTVSAQPICFIPSGATIYREGEPRRAIFQVAQGLARTVKQTSDGHRIVQSFCVPGDIFGMSCTSSYPATAEAVSDLHLVKFEPSQFDTWLECDGTSARQLWNWLVRASDRVDQLRLISRGRSIEKLSYFLLDLAERMSARSRIELQMSRYDIGDYLGLSSETVSRAFTSLRSREFIATEGRIVYLRNPSGLRHLLVSCSTRQNLE